MGLSKVEALVFGGPCSHFVTGFDFSDSVVAIRFMPMEKNRQDDAAFVDATFADAVILRIWTDPEQAWEFPLDPVGFYSEPCGQRWKFTLFCGGIEWIWESAWPTLSLPLRP